MLLAKGCCATRPAVDLRRKFSPGFRASAGVIAIMEAPKYQKSDPAILLLNEIDILLAQTRLMELYLKQAQATAANEQAGIHEQYQSELATLRADLSVKEKLLQERQAVAVDPKLGAAVEQLQHELIEKQRFISGQEAALQRSNGEIIALQKRIAEIEAEKNAALSAASDSAAIRASLSADVAALHQELEKNRSEFQQQQIAAREIESGLREQLQRLQNQIAENQTNSSGTAEELNKAQQEISALRQHLRALEALQEDRQANAARELEEARGRFENELASLRTTLAERDRTIAENQAALLNIEGGLRSEIAAIRNELEQKQTALAHRDDDLRAAGMQIAALQQRVTDLESAHRQAAAATAEIDSIRRSLAEEVAILQHEVEVKEKELTHRYEAVTAVELALHGRIQALQQELARAQEDSAATEVELKTYREQSAFLQTRIVELERAQADTSALEAIRQELESDLNRLRADLAQKEYLLAGRERAIGEIESNLRLEIDALHQQLEQERSATARINSELVQARAELTATRAAFEAQLKQKDDEIDGARTSAASQSEQLSRQINELQLQLADRARDAADLEARLGAESATLHQQLEQVRGNLANANEEVRQAHADLALSREVVETRLSEKDAEIAALRTIAAGETGQLANQVSELQLQLAEKQLLADSRATELDDLKTTIARLSEQLSENDDRYTQARALWQNTEAQQNDEIARLTAARDELSRAQTALEVQLEQARGANAGLRSELQEAKNRSAELEALRQSDIAAMAAVESDRAQLRSRLDTTEAHFDNSKSEAVRELAEVRQALETQLTAVRGELQQKVWSLAQQQASVENLAQVHREQIRKLEARLAEQQPVAEQQNRELAQALDRAASLEQQVEELQTTLRRTEGQAASQAEEIRQEYAARLENANAQMAAKSAELAKSGAVRANVEETLRAEITRLNNEMHSRSAALQSREDELDRVRGEMTSVQNRIVQLESVTARTASEASEIQQAKSALEGDLNNLRNELQQKSVAVIQQQTAIDDLAARHRSQVEQLEANLNEYRRSDEERRREIEQAHLQIALLQSRVGELQSALDQSELSGSSQTEQLRQEYQARIDALSRELTENADQIRERATVSSDIDQALRSEIDRLISEARERNQILQDRNDELVRVKGELDSLSERFAQLESNAIQAESTAAGDTELMRVEYQAQLALLQAELSQKEWALEERQAIIAGIEQEHRQQIDALRQQLAENQPTAAPADDTFEMGDPNRTEGRREKLLKLDELVKEIHSGAQASYPPPSERRWQTGFGWKRRWRS